MNPTVPQQIVDEAIERDPASASAEWNAQFRVDVKSFVAREVIMQQLCRAGSNWHLSAACTTRPSSISNIGRREAA